jgi:hypothetical protein
MANTKDAVREVLGYGEPLGLLYDQPTALYMRVDNMPIRLLYGLTFSAGCQDIRPSIVDVVWCQTWLLFRRVCGIAAPYYWYVAQSFVFRTS